MKKRLLSILLALCMVLTLLPGTAWAAETSGSNASTEPKLTQLYVINSSGKKQSLLNGVITFTLGDSYSFEAVFTNSEQIDKVYVTSTREGKTTYLEATRNGNSFVTSGYFDNDSTYVPGKIGVDFTKTVNSPGIHENVDWTAIASSIEDKSSTTISGSSSENVYATVDISGLLESEAKAIVDIAIETLDEVSGLNLIEDLKKLQSAKQDVEKYILGDGTELYLDYSKPSSQTLLVKDISGTTHKYYKMVLETVEDSVSGENRLKLDQVSEALGSVNLVSGLLNDYFSVSADADDLRQQVDNRYPTSEKREELYEAIDRYEKNRQAFTTVMTITSLVATTSDAIMPGATLIFNALVGIINVSAQKFWEYQIGMILGTEPVETNLVGDYHGVPLRSGTVTEGGYYCATFNGTYTFENVTAKLCLHGLDNVKIVNKGGDITICDYTYYESADGTVYMGHADNTISEGGNITIESGSVGGINLDGTETARIYGGDVGTIAAKGDTEVLVNEGNVGIIENDGGNVTISGGKIKQVTNKSGIVEIGDGIVGDGPRVAVENIAGTVNIAGGIIYSNSRNSAIGNWAGGTLRISGGTFVSSDSMDAISGTGTVIGNEGNAEIINGTFFGCMNSYTGEIVITGGQFRADGTANDGIIDGAFSINGGTFKASGACRGVRVFGKATINGGTFESENGPCVEVFEDAEITIHGGTFTSGGKQCVYNSGTATITAGEFTENNSNSWSNCILNTINGTMFIRGGTFYEFDGIACVGTESDNLTISGGKFLGGSYGIDNRVGESCTILIGEDTDIIVEAGIRAFDLDLLFAAEEGYSGGVIYYDSPDAPGTPMTIEQAAAIDYTQPSLVPLRYVRLVADGVSDNPDTGESGPTKITASMFTVNTDTETYTGSPITKTIVGKAGSKTLVQGTDYTVTYANNTNVGTATITITGIGDYTGTLTYTFTIKAAGTGNGGNGGGSTGGGSTTPSTPSGSSSITSSVTVSNPSTANGIVSSNATTAKKGDTVTVSSSADSGYISAAPIVKDKDGNTVVVVKNADGTYSFTMPEGGVTITGNYVTPGQMFSDLSDSAWYRDSVAYAVENGLMQGVGNEQFNPSGTTTRGMVMTILARQFGVDTTPTGSEAWYQKGMDWAVQAGVSDGTDPGGNITREQLATMLWRFAGEPEVTGILTSYPDADNISNWAGTAMIWAVQNGIINGSDGKLNPQGNATRAEAAAMLTRFCQNIEK